MDEHVNKSQRIKTRGGSTKPNSPRMVEAARRQLQALQLRIEGKSFEQIKVEVGYASRGAASNAVQAALQRWGVEPAAELRTLEMARLDAITDKLWPKIEAGNLGAISVYLQVAQRRARLLGLDAPAEMNLKGEVDHWHHDMAWIDGQITTFLARGLAPLASTGESQAALEAPEPS